jgi:DNA polymerase-1
MIAVQRLAGAQAGSQTRLIMQVHDELVLRGAARPSCAPCEPRSGLMTGVASLQVPLLVDVGSRANWSRRIELLPCAVANGGPSLRRYGVM